MAERGKLNIVLTVMAVAVLVGSGLALALASAPHGNANVVIVNNHEYTWNQIEVDFQVEKFEALYVDYGGEGVRISDIVNDTGLVNPEAYQYQIVSARDGYQYTASWDDILNGYLVKDYDKRAVFVKLRAKTFWVDTVGEINPVAG